MTPRLRSAADDGLHHVLHGGVDGLLLEPRHGAVAAHAAGVRPLVAGEDALVVLRRRQRYGVGAVAQHQQRDLGAGEVLLGDEHVAGVAELARHEAGLHGFARLGLVLADEHALAGGEAVGLDDQRVVLPALDVEQRRLEALVAPVGAGRHAAGGHDLLGEDLAALELRGLLVGAEDGQAVLLEEVGEARHERRLRPDDGEVDLLAAGEVEQRRQVVGGDRDVVGLCGGAGVARGAEDAVRERGLGEGMDEGVFSAAAAHHEDAHEASDCCWRCRRAALPPARPDARKSTRAGHGGEGRPGGASGRPPPFAVHRGHRSLRPYVRGAGLRPAPRRSSAPLCARHFSLFSWSRRSFSLRVTVTMLSPP